MVYEYGSNYGVILGVVKYHIVFVVCKELLPCLVHISAGAWS